MICKDCIHYQMCGSVNIDAPCAAFKNKADFVEVVRCKDCKWAEQVMIGQCVNWICKCPWMFERYVRDGFCSYGERRENNDR